MNTEEWDELHPCNSVISHILQTSINKLCAGIGNSDEEEGNGEWEDVAIDNDIMTAVDTLMLKTDSDFLLTTDTDLLSPENSSSDEEDDDGSDIPTIEDLTEAAADGLVGSMRRFLLITRQIFFCKSILCRMDSEDADQFETEFKDKFPRLSEEASQLMRTIMQPTQPDIIYDDVLFYDFDEAAVIDTLVSVQQIEFCRRTYETSLYQYTIGSDNTQPHAFINRKRRYTDS